MSFTATCITPYSNGCFHMSPYFSKFKSTSFRIRLSTLCWIPTAPLSLSHRALRTRLYESGRPTDFEFILPTTLPAFPTRLSRPPRAASAGAATARSTDTPYGRARATKAARSFECKTPDALAGCTHQITAPVCSATRRCAALLPSRDLSVHWVAAAGAPQRLCSAATGCQPQPGARAVPPTCSARACDL